jgi:SAM-dependent methyltransferase
MLQRSTVAGLSERARNYLQCPACGSKLTLADVEAVCENSAVPHRFPIFDGIPILIHEVNSIFSIEAFRSIPRSPSSPVSQLKRSLRARAPTNSGRSHLRERFARFQRLLLDSAPTPLVLVVGGGIVGRGMDVLLATREIEFVETDVVIGPRTQVICDAHDIPFADRTFDGVVVQAVLEHVVDPYRCVSEIHRVLKEDALVYAETPFMQQVHLGRFDFTRFTHLGHRRLFRWFTEVESGMTAGPGTVLAWSYEHFLLSFVRREHVRVFVKGFARLTGFWLKYLDALVERKPGALDAASGYWFVGRRATCPLPDRELIADYRGAQGRSLSEAVTHTSARC